MNPTNLNQALRLLVTGAIAGVGLSLVPVVMPIGMPTAEASSRLPDRRPALRRSVNSPSLAPLSSPNRSNRSPRRFQPRSRQTSRPPSSSRRISRSRNRQTNSSRIQPQRRPTSPRPVRSRRTLTKALPTPSVPTQSPPKQTRLALSCDDPQTQQELNRCAFQALGQASQRLTETYRQLLPNLSPTRQQLLRRSQLAWVAYRDRECRFYDSSAEGGSLQPLLSSGCKTRLTRDRTALLTRYLNGQASPNLSEDNSITEAQRQERYRQVQERLAGFQNSDYRNLRSRLLRSAEQAWQQSRTHTCRFEGSGGGNAAIAACRQWHINQRYIQLGESLDG